MGAPRKRSNRIWRIRVPTLVWPDLVESGELQRLVHEAIEKAMALRGQVKIKHGLRWVWLDGEEIERAHKLVKQKERT